MAAEPPKNLKVTGKGFDALVKNMRLMAKTEVLVGVPAETSQRDDEDSKDISNAALLYIHETGMPEQNIPARPSMGPAIEENQQMIAARLGNIARRVLMNDPSAVEKGLHVLGLAVVSAIRNKIDDGIAPPLAERTLRARARKGRKGAQEELDRRAKGEPAGMDLAKPLVDTGEMRKAITHAIRAKER